MPFGDYKDFNDCVSKNQDKNNPKAYCADIKRKIEGESLKKKDWRVLEYCVPIQESTRVNGKFIIRGIAINETVTRNNVKYQAEELEKSAHTLRNKPILKDHKNEIDSIVGRTTENVFFNPDGKNVPFEAFITDQSIQQKINDRLIQAVSIGATVKDLAEEESTEGGKHFVAKGIDFVELSLVAVPADPNAGFSRAIMESYDLKKQEIENMAKESQSKNIIEMLHCPECDKEMEDKEELKKHMKAKHKDMEEEKMAEANIAQEFETKLREKESAFSSVSEKLKLAEARLNAIEQEKLNSLRTEYKSLASDLKLNAKDASTMTAETVQMLIESLREVKASKNVEVKEVPKAETKGTVISETSNDSIAAFTNEYSLSTGSLRGYAITKTAEGMSKYKALNQKVNPFARFEHIK